jgi:hypothetical protein
MALSSVLICKGTDITPFLREYRVAIMDLDVNSTRDTAGTLHRNRVTVKRKITVQCRPLKQSESQMVLNAVSDVNFAVTYLDPQLGQTTKTFYVSDRSTPALGLNEIIWENISFELTEV